jgi:DNA modification methylase
MSQQPFDMQAATERGSSKGGRSLDARDLAVEYWPVDRLIPFARNARTHSPAQVAEIAGSIRAFGFANPILVSETGDIIAGHGRLAAARQLAMAEVPVIVLAGLSEVQRRQLVLADNRIAANAGWDMELLKLELADLRDLGCDLKTLGFTKAELGAALRGVADDGLTDEDDIPRPPEAPVAREADVWQLGAHRLACGDCTSPQMVRRLLGKDLPPLMVTDPPYGVEYDPEWRHRLGVNTSKRTGKVLNDGRADWREAWALFPGNIAYVWHGALHASTVHESLKAAGFDVRAQIVWAKPRLVIGRGDYHWQHEPCWYAVRHKGNWTGDRKQTTLWAIDGKDAQAPNENADTVHGTQKPVECMRRPMLNNSNKGDCVYEPFMGSGTTLIAAQTVGRICLGLELNPAYIDVAIRRWEEFTGQQALLIEAGEEDKSSETASPSPCDVAAAASKLVGRTFAEVQNLRLASTASQSVVPDRTEAASRETSSLGSEENRNSAPDPNPQSRKSARRIKSGMPSAAAIGSTSDNLQSS